ncbi:hypothetical protein HOP50_17g79810 [Chloropicon primus]|nr:hypothetical protein HOP50_17g79810 [Chloropicon primus]|mmetsp:Transcript_12696/g.35477  ORF Transcript_12696/g.35477 Transcript_12696/m.35477 type:complete len:526 (-) Transcript_12696:1112-2689(-)
MLSAIVDWHGSVILLTLSTGWLVSARLKRRETRRILLGKPCSYEEGSSQERRQRQHKRVGHRGTGRREEDLDGAEPRERSSVFAFVPAKGLKEGSVRNWLSFVEGGRDYQGRFGMCFCIESEEDVACAAVRESVSDHGVVICGRAATCSQKLHNIVSGIKALKEGKIGSGRKWDYVLFLDDDIKIHDKLIDNLVDTMEANRGKDCFMCTAYPFDVPALGACFLSYCVAAYHMRLIIAFSIAFKTTFVWGGCMMYRTQDLLKDAYGLVSSWENGGYSDDLIASSVCQANGLTIMCNPSNVLIQRIPKRTTLKQYWNYMSRQVFVLDTYTSGWHKRLNHMLIVIHVYLSTFFVLAVIQNLIRYGYGLVAIAWFLVKASLGHSEVYQYSTRLAYVHLMRWLSSNVSAVFFFLCVVLGFFAMTSFVRSMDRLFAQLYGFSGNLECSTKKKGKDGARADNDKETSWYSLDWGWSQYVRMWAALCIDVALFVPAAFKTLVSDEIDWSGIRYTKRDGLIQRVVHQPGVPPKD